MTLPPQEAVSASDKSLDNVLHGAVLQMDI
jgi:hypothetical protein